MSEHAPKTLARLVDPAALDDAAGPRAVARVAAPVAWLEAGGELAWTAPARLPCARCDGGGCDACGRSGALATPADPGARRVVASLPPGNEAGVALRLLHPFGDRAAIEQLIVEIRPGPASAGLAIVAPASLAVRAPPSQKVGLALVVLALLAAVVATIVADR